MNLQFWIDYIYAFLPKVFSRNISSNTHKIVTTVANELFKTFKKKEDVKKQIPVATASGESLDKHAIQYGLIRAVDESDDAFRQRLLNSFISSQLTKKNLQALADLILVDFTSLIEEPVYDRWFLTELNIETNTHIVFTSSKSKNTFSLLNPNIYEITDIWLQSDSTHIGVNYAEYINYPIEDNENIMLTVDLPEDVVGIEVWYTEIVKQSPYQKSWLSINTIIHPRLINYNLNLNSAGEIEDPIQTVNDVTWQTHSDITMTTSEFTDPDDPSKIYYPYIPQAQILYFDENYLVKHSWETDLTKDKKIIINNKNKTSEKIIQEVQVAENPYLIQTNERIANVESILVEGQSQPLYTKDIEKIVDNFIFLKNQLPSLNVRVTYSEDIDLDYSSLLPELFFIVGKDDPVNTIYAWLETGIVDSDDIKNFTNSLVNNAAAGVRLLIGLYASGLYYGQFSYGEGYYGGMSNPVSRF